jgi:hypothetical protein
LLLSAAASTCFRPHIFGARRLTAPGWRLAHGAHQRIIWSSG